jgi:membrane protein DedA with SNARE-associated domain
VTAHLHDLLDFIGLHPNLAIAGAFIVSAGEALPVVGLFSPSTVVLIGIGGFVGLGKLSFWPVFIATILGAAIGDSISYWTGRIYKERLVEIWPFSRYHGLLPAGQRHFAHRGGASIVVGRFIPGIKPVVSGVAGIMGMGAVRFTLLNLLSATAWAAVHILPGFSAGLTLAGLNVIIDGLAVVVGILAIGIVLAMWLAKGAIGSWLRHLTRFQISLLDWAHRRGNRVGHASARLAARTRRLRQP